MSSLVPGDLENPHEETNRDRFKENSIRPTEALDGSKSVKNAQHTRANQPREGS